MKNIARFDFGNTSVNADAGWCKIERVWQTPCAVWVSNVFGGWCETEYPKPLHDYIHGKTGDFRVGLAKGEYKIKLYFYDNKRIYPPFKVIFATAKPETPINCAQPYHEIDVAIPNPDKPVIKEITLNHPGGALAFMFLGVKDEFIINAIEIFGDDDKKLEVIYKDAPKTSLPTVSEVMQTEDTDPYEYLRTMCDWLIEHKSADGFLGDFESAQRLWYTTAYPMRTIMAMYGISGEQKYIDVVIDILDRLVSEQMPEGGFTQAYRDQKTAELNDEQLDAVRNKYWMNLADIGSMVAALISACNYVKGERRERYINAARLYLDKWASRFMEDNGGVRNAWLGNRFAQNIYSVSTGMTALSMAMFYEVTGEESYLKAAEKSARFMMKDWNENGMLLNWTFDGVYPGHPIYQPVTEFGDVFYTYETLSCILALTKDEALKREIYDVYKKTIFGTDGLLAAKQNASWWNVQNAWNNSKSVGVLLVFQDFIEMSKTMSDDSVDMQYLKNEYELCKKFLTTAKFAKLMGVMLEDPKQDTVPFEKHGVQSWTGSAVSSTGFAGLSVAQMVKYGIIYLK